MSPSIKAIIFDLDGTLLNTIQDIARSMNLALANVGIPPYTEEEYKLFVGEGVHTLVKRVLAKYPQHHHQESAVYDSYMAAYARHQFDTTHPYEGILELLETCSKHSIRIAVLSNKPHLDTLKVVQQYFPFLASDDVWGKKPQFQPKPHPDSLLALLHHLQLPRHQVWYVGDTATDMMTAKRGGLTAVGVMWGFRQKAELVHAHADFIVSHPMEIWALIQEHGKEGSE